ncbi:MAG: hypothetical protein IPL93_07885 [Actinomycetales bacterium]|nr:hypothetical protein [Actinomycetales bacterium]
MAVDAILKQSHEAAEALAKVSSRYSGTAYALAGYAPELREAQRMADEAWRLAAAAEPKRRESSARAHDLWLGWRTSFNPDDAANFEELYHQQKAAAETHAGEVAHARHLLEQAIKKRDEAASVAQSKVRDALEHSEVNDTILDYFKEIIDKGADLLSKIGKWIWDNIDTIALVLTVVAAITAFIPGVNVIAPALLAISKGAQLLAKVKAAVTAVQAVWKGVKTGNWGDAIGVGVGYLLGKVVGKVGGSLVMKDRRSIQSLARKYIGLYNGKLHGRVTGNLKVIETQRVRMGITERDIANRVLHGQVDNRRAVREALATFNHSPNAAFASSTVQRVEATAGLMKGTDLTSIRGELSELAKLSGRPTVVGQQAHNVAEGAAFVVETGFEEGGKFAVSQVQKYMNAYRQATQTCGSGAR